MEATTTGTYAVYRHTQVGTTIIVSLGLGVLLVMAAGAVTGFNLVTIFILTVLGLCLLLFSWLTVTVSSRVLEVRFGVGLVRRRIRIDDIVSCEEVRTPWYYGYGIRCTPRGWLFNVSGAHAVMITFRSSRTFMIGTDQPTELCAAIRSSLR